MFQDEAGFGRFNKPKYCWCEKGVRPVVPCHHIREYRYAYGSVGPWAESPQKITLWKSPRFRDKAGAFPKMTACFLIYVDYLTA